MSNNDDLEYRISLLKMVLKGICVALSLLFFWPILLNPAIWGAIFFIRWILKGINQ